MPCVALNFACTSAGVMVQAELEMWQVLQVRPFDPKFWKNGLLISIPAAVLKVESTPVESGVSRGLGMSLVPKTATEPSSIAARDITTLSIRDVRIAPPG